LGGFLGELPRARSTEPIERLTEYLVEGRRILDGALSGGGESDPLPPSSESLRWFPLPAEV
jgi:hypothetical protein